MGGGSWGAAVRGGGGGVVGGVVVELGSCCPRALKEARRWVWGPACGAKGPGVLGAEAVTGIPCPAQIRHPLTLTLTPAIP